MNDGRNCLLESEELINQKFNNQYQWKIKSISCMINTLVNSCQNKDVEMDNITLASIMSPYTIC